MKTPVILTALFFVSVPSSMALTGPLADCDWPDRVWGAELSEGYQELRLIGLSSGKATITEFRDGSEAWVAEGHFQCSEGYSVCFLQFPVDYSDEATGVAYAAFEDGDRAYVVAPMFGHDIYYGSRSGIGLHGLVVEWKNGYSLEDNEMLIGADIYKLSSCANQ